MIHPGGMSRAPAGIAIAFGPADRELLGDHYSIACEFDPIALIRHLLDRRQAVEREILIRRIPRLRAHHLAPRQGCAILQVGEHEIERFQKIVMQGDVRGREHRDQGVEVLRVRDFDVAETALLPFDELVQPEVGARAVIRRDDAVRPAGLR